MEEWGWEGLCEDPYLVNFAYSLLTGLPCILCHRWVMVSAREDCCSCCFMNPEIMHYIPTPNPSATPLLWPRVSSPHRKVSMANEVGRWVKNRRLVASRNSLETLSQRNNIVVGLILPLDHAMAFWTVSWILGTPWSRESSPV